MRRGMPVSISDRNGPTSGGSWICSTGASAATGWCEEIDTNRFFRRDNFTYSDLLLSGFKMVFLILAAAFVLGALAGLAIRGAKRALRRKLDLEDESVVHLGLDGLPAGGKKPETSRDESR